MQPRADARGYFYVVRCCNLYTNTHEKFMQQINEFRPDVEILSEFNGMTNNVCVRYSKCGHEVWIKARSVLKGPQTGLCSTCGKSIAGKRKTKTHEEFVDDLRQKNTHNIRILGKYTGCKNFIKVECLDCNFVWNPCASDLLGNHGCPMCGGTRHYTPEEYATIYARLSQNTTLLSEYVDNTTPIHRQCNDCGYDWWCLPGVVRQECGCPKCSGRLSKTTEQFSDELHKTNPYIKVVGEYVARHRDIDVECTVCGHHWKAQPGNLLCGWGCPKCKASRGERRIMKHLDVMGILYKKEYSFPDCKDVRVLPFDIYIPSKNMVVEYDGEQHFHPVKFGGSDDDKAESRYLITVEHDKIKNNYCANNGIRVLRIPYTEYDNIEIILDKHLL